MEHQTDDTVYQSRYRFVIVAAILLNMALTYASSQMTSPLLTAISADLGRNVASAGILTTAAMLMMGISMVFGGSAVSEKLTPKYTAALGYALCIAGNVIVLVSRVFSLLLVGRVLAGAGIGFEMAVNVYYISTWIVPAKRPLVFTMITVSSVGSVFAAMFTAVPLSEAFGSWHAPFGILAALELAGMVIWLFVAKDNPAFSISETTGTCTTERRDRSAAASVLRRGDIWILAVFFALTSVGGSAVMTYLPAYYETVTGFTAASASAISAFTQVASVCGSLAISVIAAKSGRRKPFCLLASVAAALFTALFVSLSAAGLSVTAVMLYSVCSGVFSPITQTMTTEMKGATPAVATAAYSFVLGMAALFAFLPPFILSLLTETFGMSLVGSFYVFAGFFVLALAVGLLVRETGRYAKKE